jgi:hypothetical protein
MREIRTSGSEGGGVEPNRRSLPLSGQPLELVAPGFPLIRGNDEIWYGTDLVGFHFR